MTYQGQEKFQLSEVFQKTAFNQDVEDHASCAMNNRLETQVKDLTNDDWYRYASQLFSAHRPDISSTKSISHECSVKIFIDCAESLAAKDVDGTSDPYCAASVSAESNYKSLKHFKGRSMVATRVIPSTIDPIWRESFEIQIDRNLVKNGFLHIQIWDTDDSALCSNRKKIRGLSGLGRLVKEKAQSAVSNKDDHDDFMGYAVLPLNTIPAEGCEKWLKLQPSSSFQEVSGRIKVKLEVNAIQKQAKSSRFPIDLLFAGLLKAIVDDTRKNIDKTDGCSCWNGDLPEMGKLVLREMSQQNSIPNLIREIVRWEVYVDCHLNSEEVDFLLLDGIIEQIKKFEHDLDRKNDAQKLYHYSLRTIRSSVRDFMKNCCDKIANHRVEYSRDKNNYVISLGGLLFCVKKLALLSSFQDVDFHEQVVLAVADGTDHYYANLYAQYLEGEVTHDDDQTENEEDEFQDYGLKVLLKFVQKLLNDLIISKTVYHDVFQKILSVDYFTAVYRVIHDNLSTDFGEVLSLANKKLVSISDAGSKESEHLSTLLFNMYAKVRDIALLKKHVNWEDAPNTQQTEEENGSERIDMSCFQNWFRPALLRWLQMSRIKTTLLLKKAVEVDQMKSVDEIVKHTSSAVDTMGCLDGVLTFWNNLCWPDPVDAYTIALRLTDEVATMIEIYADMVHGKLRQVGFFDDEGQFDVTEELCLAVNNLQFVKSYIDNLKIKMKYDGLATAMEKVDGAPPRERVMNTFNSLVRGALVGINKKLENVSSVIGNKLKPDMQKYLKSIAKDVVERSKKMDIQSREMMKAKNTKVLDDAASEAIKPLMNYLTENIIRFREWLNQEIFLKMLKNLWTVLMKSVRKVILDEFNDQPPGFYYQWKLIMENHLICFFHADGSGLSMNALKSGEDYKTVASQLRIQSSGTEDLLSLFFCKMLAEQTSAQNKCDFGHLNVYAHYDRLEQQLKVDVISAEKLVPLDVNGHSDPFVVICLVPKPMFPNVDLKKTHTVKKTTDPLFDCSYSIDLDYKSVTKEGTFLHFSVFDADVIGRDELEGEAVLPLSSLDGVGEKSSSTKNRTFKLPLTQPKNEDQFKPITNPNLLDIAGSSEEHRLMIEGMAMAPLTLLMKRMSFDDEANQFCKERSKVKTLTPPSESKKSSFASIFS